MFLEISSICFLHQLGCPLLFFSLTELLKIWVIPLIEAWNSPKLCTGHLDFFKMLPHALYGGEKSTKMLQHV